MTVGGAAALSACQTPTLHACNCSLTTCAAAALAVHAAEDDESLTAEEKALLRFQKQRLKELAGSKFAVSRHSTEYDPLVVRDAELPPPACSQLACWST